MKGTTTLVLADTGKGPYEGVHGLLVHCNAILCSFFFLFPSFIRGSNRWNKMSSLKN